METVLAYLLSRPEIGLIFLLGGLAWSSILSPWLFEVIAAHGGETEPRASLTALAIMLACLVVPVVMGAIGVSLLFTMIS